jgi:hypothetical protein
MAMIFPKMVGLCGTRKPKKEDRVDRRVELVARRRLAEGYSRN